MSSPARVVIDDQNPWPGLGAFDEAAEQFFNGRVNEAAALRRLVLNSSLTVLFGASGLGKTSLIQAGLFPSSRKEHFLPIYVRLDVRDKSGPLIEQVKFAFQQQVNAHEVDAPPFRNGESLWEYLHRAELELWSARNQLLTPLFVFDQFEEVFTLGAENAAATRQLRTDLADLIENRVPDAVAKAVSATEATTDLALDSQRYRVVLSFREDFLPAVESWKRDLPSLLRNRLRLLPMSQERAFEAVHQTAPKLVSEKLAREIVEFVAAAQDDGAGRAIESGGDTSELSVEPALLSLVCHGLNEKRKAQRKAAFDEELLAGSKQSIISDFYRKAVGDLPGRVRDFIGKELITGRGFRKPYDVDDARTIYGVTDRQLRLLVDRRLLRIEPQRGTERVELTHDLLTRVVRQDRDRREWVRRQLKRLAIVAGVVLVLAALLLWAAKRQEDALRRIRETKAGEEAQEKERHLLEDAQQKAALDAAQARADSAEANVKMLQAEQRAETAEQTHRAERLADKADYLSGKGDSALPLSMLLALESMKRQPFIDNQAVLGKGLPLLAKPLGALSNSPAIEAVTFTNDGLLVTSEAGFVRVWDPMARKLLHQFPIAGKTDAIAVSADGNLLAVAFSQDQQGSLQVYNLHTGDLDRQRKIEVGAWHIFVGANGNVTAVIGTTLYHWKDWSDEQGTLPQALISEADLSQGGALAVSSDQTSLAVLDPEHTKISVHDFLTGEMKHSWPVSQFPVEDIAFDPSNSNRLASFEPNGTIKLWNVSRQESEFNLPAGPINGIEFSSDGRLLATNGSDGIVKVWDVHDGKKAAEEVGAVVLQSGPATAIAVDGSNGLLAVAKAGPSQLWQVGERPLPNLSGIKVVLGVLPSLHLAVGTCDDFQTYCVVRFENGKPGELLQKFTEKMSLAGGLTFSSNGRFVAGGFRQPSRSITRTETTVIWDTTTGERLSPEEPGGLLGFTPDSDGVILRKSTPTGKIEESVIWNPRDQSFVANVPPALKTMTTNLAFSADGQSLATLRSVVGDCENPQPLPSSAPESATESPRYCVMIWHWPDGKSPLKTIDVGGRVTRMSFSSDGHFLLTAAGDPFLRIWNIQTGKEAGQVGLYRAGVPLGMAFTSGDNRIVAFDRYSFTDSPWRPADLLKEVCARVGRSLTRREWDEFLPTEKGKYVATCEK